MSEGFECVGDSYIELIRHLEVQALKAVPDLVAAYTHDRRKGISRSPVHHRAAAREYVLVRGQGLTGMTARGCRNLCSSFIITGLNTSIDPGLVAVDGTVIWKISLCYDTRCEAVASRHGSDCDPDFRRMALL